MASHAGSHVFKRQDLPHDYTMLILITWADGDNMLDDDQRMANEGVIKLTVGN